MIIKHYKNLKWFSLFLIWLAVSFISLQAAYLTNVPVKVSQPDGQVLNLFVSGDEYYNWLHDQNGFTIIRDPQSGYLAYAIKANGDLIPSSLLAGRGINPNVFGYERQALNNPEQRQTPEEIFPTPADAGNAPRSGTLNNIVIFIRFSDESEFTDSISSYNSLFNTETPGANSMRNYFYEVSYNNLTIPSTFYPTPAGTVISFQASLPRSYYQPYDVSTNPGGYSTTDGGAERQAREHALLKIAVDAISAQVPAGLNIDSDGDGRVDNVCFVVSGTPGAWSSLLWPHRWSLWSVTANINGKRVYDYNFQLQSTTLSWGVGVLSHEMFHSLGSPDLYHYSMDGFNPVGPWDLMESTYNPPEHMLMYMKWKYGFWLTTIPQITASGTYTLNPTTSATNNCYKIASPNSTTQYFIIEYRKRVGTFENVIPGEGLIVYRINTAVSGGNRNGPPDEVYVYRPNGSNSVNGTVSQANFSSNAGRTAINDTTNPSSFLSDGKAGGLNISNITAADSTISFDYEDSSITPTLTITAPAAAALWEKNKYYTITWLKQGAQNPYVKIMLYKGKSTLVKTLASKTENDGAYAWLVPTSLSLGNTYFIRIQTVDNALRANSDKFSIIVPTITVSAPTKGSVWVKNATMPIIWSKIGTQDANVKIQLYKGTAWTLDINLSTENDGAFDWIVPGILANGLYTIRITTLDNQVKGISKSFNIVSGLIKVTAPAAGTKWQRDVAHTITWSGEGTLNANVKIQLLKGSAVNITIAETAPNNGSYEWIIPANKTLASNYKIRITTVDKLVKGNSSNFAIIR